MIFITNAVSLTKTKKKRGQTFKQNAMDKIKESIAQYENVFVFSFENMRNQFMQEIRMKFRDNSRFA